MRQIWLIKETYEKNASDGVSYFFDRSLLAEAVMQAEDCGGHVQVYECVPVEHKVYTAKANIEIYNKTERE